MVELPDRYVIRTTDRGKFKDCRQAWDWGSKIRHNLEPNREDDNLTFGTAIHAGLEVWYKPELWGSDPQVRLGLMIPSFVGKLPVPGEDAYDEERIKYRESIELGTAMLTRYTEWSMATDRFRPVFVEKQFEVPILVPEQFLSIAAPFPVTIADGARVTFLTTAPHSFTARYNTKVRDNFFENNYHLYFNGRPAVYQGRIDLLVETPHGGYRIIDHKTASKFDDTDHLEMDEQCGSYGWALRHMLGLWIEGIDYNELRKSIPEPPKVLKNGTLSKDKSQSTTYQLYTETLAQHGQSVVQYEDHLTWLRDNEKQFFRRTPVYLSQRQLELLGERICVEAIDMLNNPQIYPNPSKFQCKFCKFKPACLAKMDGSDHTWILNEQFHIRVKEEV